MRNLKQVGIDELASSFDDNGYMLMMSTRVPYSLSIEESIVSALVKQEPRLVEAIPTILTKNIIDYGKLKNLVNDYSMWNEFGYVGEFALTKINNDGLKKLVEHCFNTKKSDACLLDDFESFYRKRQKPQEKKWNLIGAPSYQALEKQFRRYNE